MTNDEVKALAHSILDQIERLPPLSVFHDVRALCHEVIGEEPAEAEHGAWVEFKHSSTLKRMKYHPVTSVLTIEFKSGGTYTYAEVPENLAFKLATAEKNKMSPGELFHAEIRSQFAFGKLGSGDG